MSGIIPYAWDGNFTAGDPCVFLLTYTIMSHYSIKVCRYEQPNYTIPSYLPDTKNVTNCYAIGKKGLFFIRINRRDISDDTAIDMMNNTSQLVVTKVKKRLSIGKKLGIMPDEWEEIKYCVRVARKAHKAQRYSRSS